VHGNTGVLIQYRGGSSRIDGQVCRSASGNRPENPGGPGYRLNKAECSQRSQEEYLKILKEQEALSGMLMGSALIRISILAERVGVGDHGSVGQHMDMDVDHVVDCQYGHDGNH